MNLEAPDIAEYELSLPWYDPETDIDRYEQHCLSAVFHALDVLPSTVRSKVGRATDYSGPAAYCTALAGYVEAHSPFIVRSAYEETYDD